MGGIVEAALFLLGKAAAAILIPSACVLAGSLLRPRRAGDAAAERVPVAAALGMALLAQALLLLGLAGALTPVGVVVLLAAVAAAAAWLRRRDLRDDFSELSSGLSRVPLPLRLAGAALLLLLSAPALRPPTAFDETLYHLPYARAFAEAGGLTWLADVRYPIFPQAAEALFAACLLLADDVAAHLVPLLATLLSAWLAAVWASREAGAPGGLLAAALLLGEPVAAYHAGTAYVDPVLMLFVTGCLYALSRAGETGEKRWVAIAGFFAGTGASVKYPGAYLAAAAAALLLFAGGRPRWRRAALFACVAAAAALPTYGRLVAETGNPVFPFAASIFGEGPWSDWGRVLRPPETGGSRAIARVIERAVQYPGDLLLRRGPLWHPPVSPLLALAGVIAIVRGIRRPGAARALLALAASYLPLILILPPDPRFLLPFAPAAAALGAVGASSAIRRLDPAPAARVAALAALAALAPGAAYLGQLEVRRGLLPMTAAARERYLESRLPAYRAIRALNLRHGSRYSLYAFGVENMAYFAQGRFRGDHLGPWGYESVLSRARGAGGLEAALRAIGATHVLSPRGSVHDARTAAAGLIEEFRDEQAVVYWLPAAASSISAPTPPPS